MASAEIMSQNSYCTEVTVPCFVTRAHPHSIPLLQPIALETPTVTASAQRAPMRTSVVQRVRHSQLWCIYDARFPCPRRNIDKLFSLERVASECRMMRLPSVWWFPPPAAQCKVCKPELGHFCDHGVLAPAPGYWHSCPNSEGVSDDGRVFVLREAVGRSQSLLHY